MLGFGPLIGREAERRRPWRLVFGRSPFSRVLRPWMLKGSHEIAANVRPLDIRGKFARVEHFTDNRIGEVTRPQSLGLDQSALPVQARRILSDSPIKLPARFNVPMR